MEKEHITPNGVGRVFYQFLADTENDVAEHYRSQLCAMNISEKALVAELVAIRWLALDLGATMVLGYGPRRNAVHESLTDCLHENLVPEFKTFLSNRLRQYAEIITAIDQDVMEMSVRIGVFLAMLTFQRVDGSESDRKTIQCIGAAEFKAMFDEAENIFEEKTPFTIDW